MGKLGIHSANISFQNLLSVFIMKSQLGESTTAGWMSQVPLCPDLHLGPVTAPSLQPHVNGTCCDCCWCQSWQGPVQSAGLQSLAPLHSGISQICSRAGDHSDGGGLAHMWATESVCGWWEAGACIWWPLPHPYLSILSPCPGCVSLLGCVRNDWFLTDFSGFTCAGQWHSVCALHTSSGWSWWVLTPGGVWGTVRQRVAQGSPESYIPTMVTP